jgi:hypothetical protein
MGLIWLRYNIFVDENTMLKTPLNKEYTFKKWKTGPSEKRRG